MSGKHPQFAPTALATPPAPFVGNSTVLHAPENTPQTPPAGETPSDIRAKTGVLSVLMPIYNERATLPGLLQRIQAVPVAKEIILVDDASTDGTRELLKTEIDGVLPGVRVFYHDRNQGKGAAIRTAIPYAAGEFCIIQDGDLEYDPQDYIPILQAFQEPGVDVVYGSRFQRGWPNMRLPNRLVNKLLAWMVRFFFHMPMTDEATCYKAFRTGVLQSLPLTCRRFEFCPEVTAKAIRRGPSHRGSAYSLRSPQHGRRQENTLDRWRCRYLDPAQIPLRPLLNSNSFRNAPTWDVPDAAIFRRLSACCLSPPARPVRPYRRHKNSDAPYSPAWPGLRLLYPAMRWRPYGFQDGLRIYLPFSALMFPRPSAEPKLCIR